MAAHRVYPSDLTDEHWVALAPLLSPPSGRGRPRRANVRQVVIVQRPPTARGFLPQPHRWVVERSFAWLGRARRLSKDYGQLPWSPRRFSTSPASTCYCAGSPHDISNSLSA